MNSIESDVKVKYCLNGRSVPGFSGFDSISSTSLNTTRSARLTATTSSSRRGFPNLTNSIRATVAEYLLSSLYEQNEELEDRFTDNLDTINEQIANRFGADAVASGAGGEAGSGGGGEAGSNPNPAALTAAEATQDATNRNQCICNANHKDNKDKGCYSAEDPNSMKKSDGGNKADNNTNRAAWYVRELNNIEGNYDAATNICTVRKVKYKCTSYNGTVCKNWDSGTTIGDPELIQMPISGME